MGIILKKINWKIYFRINSILKDKFDKDKKETFV
jgi:hypothetical protein